MQLRGSSAKGYAFDRRYGAEHTSDNIYDDCVKHLVDNLFKVGSAAVGTCVCCCRGGAHNTRVTSSANSRQQQQQECGDRGS